MAVEIDSLEINISSNGDDAAKGVAKLTRQLQKLYALTSQDFGLEKLANGLGAVSAALGTLSAIKTGGITSAAKAVSKIGSAAAEAGASMQQLGEGADGQKSNGIVGVAQGANLLAEAFAKVKGNVQKLLAPVKKLVVAIGRVALYRAIRAALKMLTQAIKEGVQNAYQYSKMINGDFAKSMDEAASAVLYMKNALGSALIPIIQALTPYLVQFADSFASVANKIAEMMAAFNGSDTFIKAKKSATEYAKAVNEATKATLKFDELNQISNKNENNIADMFEEMAVDTSSGSGKFGAWLKRNLAVIGAITGMIAATLGLILLFSGHIGVGLGLVLLGVASLGITAKEFNSDIITNKIKDTAIAIMAVGGAVFTVLGLILLFSGHVPLGLGFLLAGGASLVTAIVPNKGYIRDWITEECGKIASFFESFFNGVLQFFGKIAKKIANVFHPIFAYIANGFIGVFEGFFNFFIRGYNAIAKAFNKLGGNAEILKELSFGRVSLDTYSDNNVEYERIVTPSVDWNGSSLASELGAAVGNAIGSSGGGVPGRESNVPIILNVVLDGKQIAASVQNANNDSGVQIGKGGIVNGYGFAYAK